MKKFLAFILLICFSAQTFNQLIIRLDFLINQSYISANLCENRDKPMLHCDGKCILAKKLAQQQKQDQQQPEKKLQAKNEVISSRSFFTTQIDYIFSSEPGYIISSDNNTVDRSFPVFHPPCS